MVQHVLACWYVFIFANLYVKNIIYSKLRCWEQCRRVGMLNNRHLVTLCVRPMRRLNSVCVFFLFSSKLSIVSRFLLAMMDNLSRTDEKQLPLLKVLLGQTNDGGGDTRFAVGVKRAVIDAIVDDLVLAHRLNVDQHDVLLRCANW
jgi:hypothetical protein